MRREACIEQIFRERLIVLARRIPLEKLLPALTACADNGVTLFESTFDHTLDKPIEENVRKLTALQKALGGRIRFGAGTVLTREEVRAARDAGCEYIISPDCDPEVIEETQKLGMVSIPGAMTPSEIKRAWKLGADIVKLFPADDLGYHYIQNLMGPLGHIPLMATGGVNPASIPEFFRRGIKAVGTGITVFRPDLIAEENYEAIGVLAGMHVNAIRLYRG